MKMKRVQRAMKRYEQRAMDEAFDWQAECINGDLPIKPGLHFYKYLQPFASISGIQQTLTLNIPETILCEVEPNTDVCHLWLSTDMHTGNIITRKNEPDWKKLFCEKIEARHQNQKNPHKGYHGISGIYKEPLWTKDGTSNTVEAMTTSEIASKLDQRPNTVVCVQEYIYCKGSQPSIYRLSWSKESNRVRAWNIVSNARFGGHNDSKELKLNISESELSTLNGHASQPFATFMTDGVIPVEGISRPKKIGKEDVTNYYSASSTSKKTLHVSKIRSENCLAEAFYAIQDIMKHVTLQLPGLIFHEFTGDFIKDCNDSWFFIQLKSFKCEMNSLFRPLVFDERISNSVIATKLPRHELTNEANGNTEWKDSHSEEVHGLASGRCDLCFQTIKEAILTPHTEHSSVKFYEQPLKEYKLSARMLLELVEGMEDRGLCISAWKQGVKRHRQSALSSNCLLCILCYNIMIEEQKLKTLATQFEDFLQHFQKQIPGDAKQIVTYITQTTQRETESLWQMQNHSFHKLLQNTDKKKEIRETSWDELHHCTKRFRWLMLFHELQELDMLISKSGNIMHPSDYFLSYSFGQSSIKVVISDKKTHSSSRWHLQELRSHLCFAESEIFQEYCNAKKIFISLYHKKRLDEPDGIGVLNLRSIFSAFKEQNWKCDKLDTSVSIKMFSLGKITLKLTIGLVCHDALCVSHKQKYKQLILENGVYWPPLSYHSTSEVFPSSWMGLLATSSSKSIPSTSHVSILKAQVKNNNNVQPKTRIPFPQSYVERIVLKLTCESTCCRIPTIVLGTLLRWCLLDPRCAPIWINPVKIALTRHYDIETLFSEIPTEHLQALALVGELLLVLLNRDKISSFLDVKQLKTLSKPYWMAVVETDSLDVSRQSLDIVSELDCPSRISWLVWNSSVRRLTCYKRALFRWVNDANDDEGDSFIYMAPSQSFTNLQAQLVTCKFFEKLEHDSSGLINTAELRSFLQSNRSLNCDQGPSKSCDSQEACLSQEGLLSEAELDDIASRITYQEQMFLSHLQERLWQSEGFKRACSHFDRYAEANMTFKEFCLLLEANETCAPSIKIFCFRHGICRSETGFTCIDCLTEYNGLPLKEEMYSKPTISTQGWNNKSNVRKKSSLSQERSLVHFAATHKMKPIEPVTTKEEQYEEKVLAQPYQNLVSASMTFNDVVAQPHNVGKILSEIDFILNKSRPKTACKLRAVAKSDEASHSGHTSHQDQGKTNFLERSSTVPSLNPLLKTKNTRTAKQQRKAMEKLNQSNSKDPFGIRTIIPNYSSMVSMNPLTPKKATSQSVSIPVLFKALGGHEYPLNHRIATHWDPFCRNRLSEIETSTLQKQRLNRNVNIEIRAIHEEIATLIDRRKSIA